MLLFFLLSSFSYVFIKLSIFYGLMFLFLGELYSSFNKVNRLFYDSLSFLWWICFIWDHLDGSGYCLCIIVFISSRRGRTASSFSIMRWLCSLFWITNLVLLRVFLLVSQFLLFLFISAATFAWTNLVILPGILLQINKSSSELNRNNITNFNWHIKKSIGNNEI